MNDYASGQIMGKIILLFGKVLGEVAALDPREAVCHWGLDLGEVYPHQWYPAHRLRAMLEDVEDIFPGVTLPDLGARIAQHVDWTGVTDLRGAFIRAHELYHQTHRSQRRGYFYPAGSSQRRHLRIAVQTIYPKALEYGLCLGIARRFAAIPETITVLQPGCAETASGRGQTVYYISRRDGAAIRQARLNSRYAAWYADEAASIYDWSPRALLAAQQSA